MPLLEQARPYKTPESFGRLLDEVSAAYSGGDGYPSAVDLRKAVSRGLSSDDTFYGRFYRQLRLEQLSRKEDLDYVVAQVREYWDGRRGQGPSISEITRDRPLGEVFDIYRYGVDSYGNMYCLYKQYDPDMMDGNGRFGYKYAQSTPGELWIRLKDHPFAFPAFSGAHPNVYIGDAGRHVAFANLLRLYRVDEQGAVVQVYGPEASADSAAASCIYDFELTKDQQDLTFVTMMRDLSVQDMSRYV